MDQSLNRKRKRPKNGERESTKRMIVQVYFNLHKKCFSQRNKRENRVMFYSHNLYLENAKFIVNESGRKKVLQTKVKNVHAYIEAELFLPQPVFFKEPKGTRIRYNPYLFESFVDSEENIIYNAKQVYLNVVSSKPVVFAI